MFLSPGALGKCLGLERGALTNGISALIKETPQNALVSATMGGYNEKSLTQKRAFT